LSYLGRLKTKDHLIETVTPVLYWVSSNLGFLIHAVLPILPGNGMVWSQAPSVALSFPEGFLLGIRLTGFRQGFPFGLYANLGSLSHHWVGLAGAQCSGFPSNWFFGTHLWRQVWGDLLLFQGGLGGPPFQFGLCLPLVGPFGILGPGEICLQADKGGGEPK